jgi:hypothetical protein
MSDLKTSGVEVPAEAPSRILTPGQLLAFDVESDNGALIGISGGKLTRYICRGYGAWLIGPSGIGKSSLTLQAAFSWALGKSIFGITPVRPLRVLIVQSENDDGDLAEGAQGVLPHLGVDEFNGIEQLNDRVQIITEITRTGLSFCGWLQGRIEAHRAEIVFVDPLLSFAGIDIARQEQCTRFLRQDLNPILQSTGAAIIGIHHTGKPRQDAKPRAAQTELDAAYSGLGSSELVNWARAIAVLIPRGDVFELKFPKRGRRAGATHPSGEPTLNVWLRHAREGIHWEQVSPPEEPSEREHAAERPLTKPEQINRAVTHSFFSSIPTEGEGMRPLGRRLIDWMQGPEASPKMVTTKSTAERAIELMLRANKLTYRDGLYFKGSNA